MSHPNRHRQVEQLIRIGNYHQLRAQLILDPELIHQRDSDNATLLIKLTEQLEEIPNATQLVRVLLTAGARVNVRRSQAHGTPLANAFRWKSVGVARVLLEFGADLRAATGFQTGSILSYAIERCRVNSQDEQFVTSTKKVLLDYTGATYE